MKAGWTQVKAHPSPPPPRPPAHQKCGLYHPGQTWYSRLLSRHLFALVYISAGAEEAPAPVRHLAALPWGTGSLPACGSPGRGCQGPGLCDSTCGRFMPGHLAPVSLPGRRPRKPGVAPSSPHMAPRAALPFPLLACLRVHISSAPRLPRQTKKLL